MTSGWYVAENIVICFTVLDFTQILKKRGEMESTLAKYFPASN